MHYRDFVNEALYGPEGFYTRGGGAGRRRDFLTSPEVGGLFGAVIARALDAWWGQLGRPDPFLVAECGAGPGVLAATVMAAKPACLSALRYILVDTSPAMRQAHTARKLPLVDPSEILGVFPSTEDIDDGGPAPGQGPLACSMAELPSLPLHVVVANELLDNLPFDILQRTEGGWAEVRVTFEDGRWREVLVAADPGHIESIPAAALQKAERHMAGSDGLEGIPVGARVPVLRDAIHWLSETVASVERGIVLAIDYGGETAELIARPENGWLRTYRAHGRGGDPLDNPGTADITIDVPFDQLNRIRRPFENRTQAEFLRAYGIEELVAEARLVWAERASIGDFAALKARSFVSEADALLHESGLGAFRALEWHIR